MNHCKIADNKQIPTISKELMANAVMRQRNSDEKSGEGSRLRNNLSFVGVFRYVTFFLIPKKIISETTINLLPIVKIPVECTRFLLECTEVESLLVCKLQGRLPLFRSKSTCIGVSCKP